MKEVVLVTGGSGLVGQCLLAAVQQSFVNCQSEMSMHRKYVFLSSKSADLSSYQDARRVFELYQPTHVVHLAAKVGGLYANMDDKDGTFYSLNTRINENVLELSYEHRVRVCMSCLSTCIFPDQIEYPLDETKIHLGPPHHSNAGYSLAKRQVDLLNKKYNQLAAGRSLFFSIIPTNIYGPFDNFDPHQGHVIPSLINRAHSICMEYLKEVALDTDDRCSTEDLLNLNVLGSGKSLRQFIYAPDLAKLILWLLDTFAVSQESDEPTAIILCPDESDEQTIGQVAELICSIFSQKFHLKMVPKFDLSKSDGQLRKTASNRKLRQLNGKFNFTPMEQGLRETINWFCANYPNVRLGTGATKLIPNTSPSNSSYFAHEHTVQVG